MVNKLIKKIGYICLGLASLALAGCFHVPDEDWLPNKNKVKTENVKNDEEVDQAINSFMQGIDMISSERNEVKNDEINTDDGSENTIEVENNTITNEETLDNTETTDNEVENEEVEGNITPEG